MSSLRGKRVLVTGGSGVIGKELLRRLQKKEASIMSVDRKPLEGKEWENILHVGKDLARESITDLREFEPQVIFHLAAAFERSSESPEFWETNWQDNVIVGHRLVELARNLPRLETFVFASSYLNYSTTLYTKNTPYREPVYLRETDLVAPRNLCGAAKFYAERELDFLKETGKGSMKSVSARIYRVYGCGSNDVISRWIRAALKGEEIHVYNRQNRFDYIFSGDVAEGLLRLAEQNVEGVVNLGSGVSQSVEDVLAILCSLVPSFEEKIHHRGDLELFEASTADLSLLKKTTGWQPQFDLRSGMQTVFKFEQHHGR